MSDPNHKKLPDFLVQNLNESSSLSDSEQSLYEGIWSASESFKYPDAGTEQQWQNFKNKLEGKPTLSQPKRQFAMFRWVAAAVVILVAGIGIRQYLSPQDNGFSAVYKTGTEIKTVHLPDGSDIILNAQTELIVNAINASKRELVLKKGEAFFKVTHNNTPFTVQTVKGKIRVLGTEFNVKAYPSELFSVFLKNGKIDMTFSDKHIYLKPGQCLQENAQHRLELIALNDNRNFAWIDNKLVFENTSLSEVVKVLESTYKVKFVYDQQMKDEKINLTIENLTAQQAAELLSKTLNTKVAVE